VTAPATLPRAPADAGGPPARPDVARARWRRARWPLAVSALVLLAAVIGALLIPRTTGEALDPDSATPEGTRAVAQILRREGVRVERVVRTDDAVRAAVPGSTLVVVDPFLLGPDQLDRLAGLPAGVDLVLVAPDAVVLDRLAPQVHPAGLVPATVRPPGCDDPAARAAGRARAGGALYTRDTGVSCYPDRGDPAAASLVRLTTNGRRVSVLGQSQVLTNGYLAEDGNAALSLWLLGVQPVLVWYLPDPLELGAGTAPPTLGQLLPGWVGWVTLQLAVVAVVAILWRSRRLGRLVTEPLPVVVRAAETQEGRARLYRSSRARGRAAATLRTASLRRLAARLDVPAETSPEGLVVLVAEATGWPGGDVRDVLLGPAPADDAALVRLADRLDTLEASLRATRAGPGADGGAGVGTATRRGAAAP